jgi:uncharacterized protein YjiS (DUF1127 family)
MLRHDTTEGISDDFFDGWPKPDCYRNIWPVCISNAILMVSSWVHRSQSRSRLADLDDHRLLDIGVSRAQAMLESRKHFWQP